MEKYLNIIEKMPLFFGIPREKLSNVLSSLNARVEVCEKGKTVFREGDEASLAGIVLWGSVQILEEDYYGNRNLISLLSSGQLFGEALCCTEAENYPFYIVAAEKSAILLFECKSVMSNSCCPFDYCEQFMRNLLQIISQKSLLLRHKITLLSKRTTREKIMEFLLAESKRAGNNEFNISYDRQQLADFLGVDRSAMSAEISKLRKSGTIEVHKNHFKIL